MATDSGLYGAAGIGAAAGLIGGLGSSGLSGLAAKKQRKFQKKVMKNRYQWMVGDLRNAGINPMLAPGLGAGGASSSMANVPDLGAAMSTGARAGADVSRTGSQKRLMEAQENVALTTGELNKGKTALALATTRATDQTKLLQARQHPLLLPGGIVPEEWFRGAGTSGSTIKKTLAPAARGIGKAFNSLLGNPRDRIPPARAFTPPHGIRGNITPYTDKRFLNFHRGQAPKPRKRRRGRN